MKIIKPGKLAGDKVYQAKCYSCECEFEFYAKEARYVSDQRDGDFYQIACPTQGCGRDCAVNANQHR